MYLNSDDLLQDDAEVFTGSCAWGIAAESVSNVFPDEESWPNKYICPSSSFIRRSHLLYDTNLLHEQVGPRSRKTEAGRTRDRKILTWGAPTDDVHRRQICPVQLGDIPHVDHVGEMMFCHPDRERFDLAGPYRRDAIAHRSQRKAANPIKQRGHRQLYISMVHCGASSCSSGAAALL